MKQIFFLLTICLYALLFIPSPTNAAALTLSAPSLTQLIPGSIVSFAWSRRATSNPECNFHLTSTKVVIVIRDDDLIGGDDFIAFVTADTTQTGYPYLGPQPYGRGGWPKAIDNDGNFTWRVPDSISLVQCPGWFEGTCNGDLYFQVWGVREEGGVVDLSSVPYPNDQCTSDEDDLPKFSIPLQPTPAPGSGPGYPPSPSGTTNHYPSTATGSNGENIYLSLTAISHPQLQHGQSLTFQLVSNYMEGRIVRLSLARQVSTTTTATVSAVFTINGQNVNQYNVPAYTHTGSHQHIQAVTFTPLASIGTGNFFVIAETTDSVHPYLKAGSVQFAVLSAGQPSVAISGPDKSVYAVGDVATFTVRMTNLPSVTITLGLESQEGFGVVSAYRQQFTVDGKVGNYEFLSDNTASGTTEKRVTVSMINVPSSTNVKFVFSAIARSTGVPIAYSTPFVLGDYDGVCPAGFVVDVCGVCGGTATVEAECVDAQTGDGTPTEGEEGANVGLIVGLSVGGYCLLLLCSICAVFGMGLLYKANKDPGAEDEYQTMEMSRHR